MMEPDRPQVKRRRVSKSGRRQNPSDFPAPADADEEALPRKGESSVELTPTHLPTAAKNQGLVHYLDGYYIVQQSHHPFKTSGGFSDIFVGEHNFYGKVVMKHPRLEMNGRNESKMRRFRTEAEIWTTLRHPNILQFIGMIETSDHLWLISPFTANGSLPEYLEAHPDTDRKTMILQLIHAIAYLHRQNVVHGDIKGANILVSADVHVLLSDFGLSKLREAATTPSLKGACSIHWAAPELLNDDDPVKTFASGIYAFGMTIFEILSGNLPFNGCPIQSLMKAILADERPPREPLISCFGESYAELWEVAEACWVNNPSERPPMERTQVRFQSNDCIPVHRSLVEALPSPRASHVDEQTTPASHLRAVQQDSHVINLGDDSMDVDLGMDTPPSQATSSGSNFGRAPDAVTPLSAPTARHSQDATLMDFARMASSSPNELLQMLRKLIDVEQSRAKGEPEIKPPLGAEELSHSEVVPTHDPSPKPLSQDFRTKDCAPFWQDLVYAKVKGEVRVVKLFPERSGGEKAFIECLKLVGQCTPEPNLPAIQYYGRSCAKPFMVLRGNSFIHLSSWYERIIKACPEDGIIKLWKTGSVLMNAAAFLVENIPSLACEVDAVPTNLLEWIETACLDEHENALIAPSHAITDRKLLTDISYLGPPLRYIADFIGKAMLGEVRGEFFLDGALDRPVRLDPKQIQLHSYWSRLRYRYANVFPAYLPNINDPATAHRQLRQWMDTVFDDANPYLSHGTYWSQAIAPKSCATSTSRSIAGHTSYLPGDIGYFVENQGEWKFAHVGNVASILRQYGLKDDPDRRWTEGFSPARFHYCPHASWKIEGSRDGANGDLYVKTWAYDPQDSESGIPINFGLWESGVSACDSSCYKAVARRYLVPQPNAVIIGQVTSCCHLYELLGARNFPNEALRSTARKKGKRIHLHIFIRKNGELYECYWSWSENFRAPGIYDVGRLKELGLPNPDEIRKMTGLNHPHTLIWPFLLEGTEDEDDESDHDCPVCDYDYNSDDEEDEDGTERGDRDYHCSDCDRDCNREDEEDQEWQ